ncbi:MAG: N-acetylglucosamine-6-phosphate deacetylase [Firmicutes bacterium]|nr:N-acetylglucosamine-6-phosphate deacetylase [Bacillota bacterium]
MKGRPAGLIAYNVLAGGWERVTVSPRTGAVDRHPCANPAREPEWYLIPGLTDIQVNGVDSIDFNQVTLTPNDVRQAVDILIQHGVTRCCPTVITRPREDTEAILRVLATACARDGRVDAAVAGIHLEGPYLSAEDGPRGAHQREWIRDPDWEEFWGWQRAAEGRIRLVTVAPERRGARGFIRQATAIGVIVALGHHAADDDDIMDAVQAGARLVTHFGNGAHPVLPRHPNYLWTQLAHPDLWLSVIGDGIHLPASVLQVVFRQKPHRVMLISDLIADPRVDDEGVMRAIGQQVTTVEERVGLWNAPQLLAGSCTPLSEVLLRTVGMVGDLAGVLEAATVTPGRLLGWSSENIMRDWVVCRFDSRTLTVKWVMQENQLLYDNADA